MRILSVGIVRASEDSCNNALLGRGRGDEWYTRAKLQADLAFLEAGSISYETVVFDGGHEWHPEFYGAAGRFLERIRAGSGEGGGARLN